MGAAMQPSIGRIVHYKLNAGDVTLIDRQFPHSAVDAPPRNPVSVGQTCPAVVVRVFDPSTSTANLQVLLDGAASYWATSRTEGEGAGHWSWPPRVGA